ncbi:alpha/beta hydrolase [Glaciecola sp. SC05]|uniref:alpha/beta hydrolase n=1 Tax=Glaciecola sp. SC05 TaxID=1987355 RepID=UPI0035293FEC
MSIAKLAVNTSGDKTFSLNATQKLQRLALRACCATLPPLGLQIAMYHFTNVRQRRPYSLAEFPEQSQSKSLVYRDGHIVTHSWGKGGKLIFLVHGWESNSSLMKGFITPLVQQGYKVVVFDMPSHGHSSKQATHLSDFSAALEFVISVYGQPFGIIAHSFGGTATVLLLRDKQHLLPKKLCLISPMQSLSSHLRVFNTITGLSEAMMNKLLIKLKTQYALEINSTDISGLMRDLRIPGLFVHDEHDQLIPIELGDYLASIWTGARYLRTRELGHRKILKDPHVIKQVTEYMLER